MDVRQDAECWRKVDKYTPLAAGRDGVIPPKSRGRDWLAMTFLDVIFISSAIVPGVIARPGVIALMGEPCLPGVVPRDTAM
jgi:hypothetical protein